MIQTIWLNKLQHKKLPLRHKPSKEHALYENFLTNEMEQAMKQQKEFFFFFFFKWGMDYGESKQSL